MIVEISGIVSTTDLDKVNDKFTYSCIKDMAEQLSDIELYLNHKRRYSLPVGKPVGKELVKKGLRVNFVIDNECPKFMAVISAISREIFSGFSVAFQILESSVKGNRRTISKVKVKEISLAKTPANPNCILDKHSLQKLRQCEKKLLDRL